MAAAWRAAFEELSDWGRYDIDPDPKKADLIFLFSANPYLGDYVTRDGPDKRGVAVDITYMNVVDPQTGENLWGDSRQWGSLFVAKATKDLIEETTIEAGRREPKQQAAHAREAPQPVDFAGCSQLTSDFRVCVKTPLCEVCVAPAFRRALVRPKLPVRRGGRALHYRAKTKLPCSLYKMANIAPGTRHFLLDNSTPPHNHQR